MKITSVEDNGDFRNGDSTDIVVGTRETRETRETNVRPHDPFSRFEERFAQFGVDLSPHGVRPLFASSAGGDALPPSTLSRVVLNYLLALRGETKSVEVDAGPWRVDSVIRDSYEKFFAERIDDIVSDPHVRAKPASTPSRTVATEAERVLVKSEWCPALYVSLPHRVTTTNASRPGDKSSFRHDAFLPIAVPPSAFGGSSAAGTRSVFTTRAILAALHARIAGHRDFSTIDAWPALRRLVEADGGEDERQARRLVEGLRGSVPCEVRKEEHRPGFREAKKTKKIKSYSANTIGAYGDVLDQTSYKIRASSLRVFNVMCAWEALPRDEDRERIANAFDRSMERNASDPPPDVSSYDSLVPHAVFGNDENRVFDVCATRFYPRIRGADDAVVHYLLTAFREGETHQFIATTKTDSSAGFAGLLENHDAATSTFDLRTKPVAAAENDPEVLLFYLTPFVTNARPGTYTFSNVASVAFDAMDLEPTDLAWKNFFKDSRLAYVFASSTFDVVTPAALRRLNAIVSMRHVRKSKFTKAFEKTVVGFADEKKRLEKLLFPLYAMQKTRSTAKPTTEKEFKSKNVHELVLQWKNDGAASGASARDVRETVDAILYHSGVRVGDVPSVGAPLYECVKSDATVVYEHDPSALATREGVAATEKSRVDDTIRARHCAYSMLVAYYAEKMQSEQGVDLLQLMQAHGERGFLLAAATEEEGAIPLALPAGPESKKRKKKTR